MLYWNIIGGMYMKTSIAQRRATEKYLQNYEDLKIRLPRGERDRVKAFAASKGLSVNALIQSLLEREMAGFEESDSKE